MADSQTIYVTIFQEEFKAYFDRPDHRRSALHRAIDYYNKYTKKEITLFNSKTSSYKTIWETDSYEPYISSDVHLTCEGLWNDAKINPEERVIFNEAFEKLLNFACEYYEKTGDDIGIKYMARLSDILNVTQILSTELQNRIQKEFQEIEHGLDLSKKMDFASFCSSRIRGASKTTASFDRRLKRFEIAIQDYAGRIFLTER